MKPLLNTIIAFILPAYMCHAQNPESTLYEFSESIKQKSEMQFDSLPYQQALSLYFNSSDPCTPGNVCEMDTQRFLKIVKAELMIIQAKYQKSLELLSELSSADFKSNQSLYLESLLLKLRIYSKLSKHRQTHQILQQIDSIAKRSTKLLTKTERFRICNAEAGLALNEDRYSDVVSYLNDQLKNPGLQTKAERKVYANALMLMGDLQLKLNKNDSAMNCFKSAESILLRDYPKEHYEFGKLNFQIGNYYKNTGQFSESEKYYINAMAIFKNKIGAYHPDFANMLRVLANLYRRTGRFELADFNYNESIRILKQLGLEKISLYALIQTNQGLLYTLVGKRKEAERLFQQATINLESNGDTMNLDYVCTLENLANLYYNQLRLDTAESLYLKCIHYRELIQGNKHADYAECLNSLGNIYQKREKFGIAESYYIKAIDIISQESIGKETRPHFFNNLALLYSKTRQFEKAESLFLQVKLLYENLYGKMNRNYLSLLDNMAQMYNDMNDKIKATEYFIAASKLRKRIIYDSFRYLSSNEIDGYMQRFRRGISNFNNYLIQSNNSSELLLKEAFENELFYKGYLLNYHLELNKMIKGKPELISLSDSIKSIYKIIAKEYVKSPISETTIDSIEEIAHILEKKLGNKTDEYTQLLHLNQYEELKKKLRTNEAIVEMMYLNLHEDLTKDSAVYGAIIISNENPDPIFVNLCSEEELQKLFIKSNTLNADYVNALYSNNSRGLIPVEKNITGLYDLIWKKLEIYLKNINTIYYVPAGLLHKINIQAISVNSHDVVGNQFNIVQLSNSRQLLNRIEKKQRFHSALVMGGIQYDEIQSPNHYDMKLEAGTRGSSEQQNNKGSDHYWPELNHTNREIYRLNDLMKKSKIRINKYVGSDATEEVFKMATSTKGSPDIIHIATHGYFFPENDKPSKDQSDKNCPFIHSRDPMIRSGLVLAFGNYAWQNCEALPGRNEDGILTAFEISQMNLHKTKLAVLSACETGLGDIKGTEGVYGLQRAFKIAGVKYLIMSLWQIPDLQTEELMQKFYTNLLKDKMDIPQAFKSAQMDMKAKYNDPYFWAGFILVQ